LSTHVSNWGNGYVTDLPYLPGYYRHQSPLHLNLACLLGGVAGLRLYPGEPLSYVELGCGYGFGALVLAVSNPGWQVTGIDFSPAHIASAQALAAAAGIDNAAFIEADLATLAESTRAFEVPIADVASLHGLWSWVPDAVREGIVRLLATKVRPGGIVQVSYNALPAWQGALGMQRLLREAGALVTARSDRQVVAGLELVSALSEAKAHHLHGSPFIASLLEHARRCQTAYLAHEYMGEAWLPCFHADVAAALAGAKLDWVASANLLENFSPLMLSDEIRTIRDRYDDPVVRELIKDLCLPRGLRQDVFVRGARTITSADRDAALEEVVLGLMCHEAEFAWEIELPSGKAALEDKFFGPIIAELARGPRSVRDLLRLPDLPRHDNPSEMVGMLVGTEQAIPMLAPPAEADPRVSRFNRLAANAFVRSENLNTGMALGASGTGSPLPCTMLDLYVASRLEYEQMVPDTMGWAESLGRGRPMEERAKLATFIDRLVSERAPIWRMLGGLGASSAC
jgi:SAM-dependent methyltransferase